MKAVIYARFSSEKQNEASIEGQLRECLEYAEYNKIEVIGNYIDRACFARTANRPDFQCMIKDSYKHNFDCVIVWKLDRFARDRYDSAYYKNILKKNGVRVISAKETITEGASGILLESILEGYAEFYSAELAEKGLYKLSTDSDLYSVVGNAFAVLAGIDASSDERIIHEILSNQELIAPTLSMCGFVYDALLSKDATLIGYVIKDIKEKYLKMLNQGATTFWETEKGADDFDGVGSLCHGWSALPVYYLWLYKDFLKEKEQ